MPDPGQFQDGFGRALATHDGSVATPTDRALTIHRNTASKAAQDALADNYPVVRAMVGDEAFAAVAGDYVADHAPREPRLCLYGAGFATFLDDYPPFADHRYLADVARVERLVIEALFAADAPPRDANSFAVIDLDAPLALHPAVRCAHLDTPAVSFWLAHQDDAAADAIDSVVWQPESCLVTRPGNQIAVANEPPAAIAFIEGCANGLPLGEVAAAAGDQVSSIFARAISAGCFA
jgi:hypothetical protein